MRRHSALHPQHWWELAFSLPCLSFVPPSLPPFLLPASLQPSPLPLPRSSIVSAWFSSLSCSMQPCLQWAAWAKRSTASHLGSGEEEGKHFKLQSQPGKQGSADSRAHPQAGRIWMCADTYWFVSSKLKYTYHLCLCSCLPPHSHPLIYFRWTANMLLKKKKLTPQFSDKQPGSSMHSFGRCKIAFIWFTTFLTEDETHSVEEEACGCKKTNKLLNTYLWHIGCWNHLISPDHWDILMPWLQWMMLYIIEHWCKGMASLSIEHWHEQPKNKLTYRFLQHLLTWMEIKRKHVNLRQVFFRSLELSHLTCYNVWPLVILKFSLQMCCRETGSESNTA